MSLLKKKILYVENGIGYGGAIICLRHLVRHLDRNRFEPLVVTGRTSPDYQAIGNEAQWKYIPDRYFDNVSLRRRLAKQVWLNKVPSLHFISKQLLARSLSDNRYECLIFCGAIMQKKQDWACKTTSQITHS